MTSSLRSFLVSSTRLNKSINNISASCSLQSFYLDESNQTFVLTLPEGTKEVSFISYKRSNGIFELDHTYVPEALREKGVGAALAQRVLDYCLEHNIKVKLTCAYLQKYYTANAKRYNNVVV